MSTPCRMYLRGLDARHAEDVAGAVSGSLGGNVATHRQLGGHVRHGGCHRLRLGKIRVFAGLILEAGLALVDLLHLELARGTTDPHYTACNKTACRHLARSVLRIIAGDN